MSAFRIITFMQSSWLQVMRSTLPSAVPINLSVDDEVGDPFARSSPQDHPRCLTMESIIPILQGKGGPPVNLRCSGHLPEDSLRALR
jgi:hypothetical protein